jgi:hypothetical protein
LAAAALCPKASRIDARADPFFLSSKKFYVILSGIGENDIYTQMSNKSKNASKWCTAMFISPD